MLSTEIRTHFLRYFEKRGHTVVESSPLVPQDDPTLLFTNAGMVQFKRVFTGEEPRSYTRAVSCQRCIRAGGKHNDLENVGHTARHHTFFEMLGNFSFGDYFKEEAIHFAWEFLTRDLGLDPGRLWVSVYESDDDAWRIWEGVKDLPRGRIVRLGEKDNFWAMGDTGPCGPCSEIHIDQGPAAGCGRPDCEMGCDCDRFLELWNLVFMQFYRDEHGKMTPLPKPSIDTGMGLERIASVKQGRLSNYDSDLLQFLIAQLETMTGRGYGTSRQADIAMRVIADHSRASAFLVADGVLPSNEGRGYVLRRIMRRAIRFGRALGLDKPFLAQTAGQVLEKFLDVYPHLAASGELLVKVTASEEERFRETLDAGMVRLHDELARIRADGAGMIPGDFVFRLYDTYGFPADIVRDVAMEDGITIDEEGFAKAMERQRQQSQLSWKEAGAGQIAAGVRSLTTAGHRARFVGYDSCIGKSGIVALIGEDGDRIATAASGARVSVFCPETPFYAESGGQVGDAGEIIGPAGRARVTDTVADADGIILHEALVTEGALTEGETVQLLVEDSRRRRVAANHTATHILHAGLREILGSHVRQSGSLVTEERLRFDFTHFSALKTEELRRLEDRANEIVRADIPVTTGIMSRDEAMASGATALFGEKYGAEVRVVTIDGWSRELCGGTHAARSGEIGMVKIVAEGSVAAGIRRLEAMSGRGALERFQETEARQRRVAELLHCAADEVEERLGRLQGRIKEMERELAKISAAAASVDIEALVSGARQLGAGLLVAARVNAANSKALRDAGDRVRDRLGPGGITVLAAVCDDSVSLLVMLAPDLAGRLHAGKIAGESIAVIGGRGGGRPDMAQAGGGDPTRLEQALEKAVAIVTAS